MSSYKPVPVSKLLSKMQNMASLILDLAYSALLFKNHSPQLQTEVLRLETIINRTISQLEIQIMLATRDIDDARTNISFLRIGQALNRISDAAADIATLSSSGSGLPKLIKMVIQHSDERIAKVDIASGVSKEIIQKSVAELEDYFGLDIMAISRKENLHFNFKAIKLEFSDSVFLRGPSQGIDTFEKVANGDLRNETEISEQLNIASTPNEQFDFQEFTVLEREIIKSLIKLKHKSELSINLAFSALLLNDGRLANEVIRLEKELDHLDRSLSLKALKLESSNVEQRERIINLIRISKAMEEISDASLWLIEPFILNTERHPLLSSIVQEGEEKVLVYEVEEDSEAVNKTVEEFEAKVHGMWVVAIYREKVGYIFDPSPSFIITSNDTLLIRAYGKQKKRLQNFESS